MMVSATGCIDKILRPPQKFTTYKLDDGFMFYSIKFFKCVIKNNVITLRKRMNTMHILAYMQHFSEYKVFYSNMTDL